MSNTIPAWHFTNGDKLRDGRPVPPVGKWLEHEGKVKMCDSGLHASRNLLNALVYAPGCMLHRVQCGFIVDEQDDKFVCRRRKIKASADMTWALVCFAEACAVRAAARYAATRYAAARYAATRYAATRYAATRYAADDAAAAAAAAAAARYAATRYAADAAAAAAAARYAATRYAADDAADAADGERAWQEDTLQLWWQCLTSQPAPAGEGERKT